MNVNRFRLRGGEKRPLDITPTGFTGGFKGKDEGRQFLADTLKRLVELQEVLYAERHHALLIVLQGMDTAGKDSVIEHVFGGVNPEGVVVHSFKQPSSEELAHDFLWPATRVLPPRGQIAVFNRSYYEEVLVVRVHPELLAKQNLPSEQVGKKIWEERFEDIRGFERHLARSGTTVVKCFLNLSKGEQERRLLARIDDETKNWKFSLGDLPERALWKSYMAAYSDALSSTSTAQAPWYVIPADHKWYAHAAVAAIVLEALESLDLRYPTLSQAQRKELLVARRELTAGKKKS